MVLHCLCPILLPVNMGITQDVAQDELQGGEGQRKGQKFIQARRRFTALPNIKSLMSPIPKAKVKI